MPDYMFLLESRLSPEQRAVLTRVQELSAAMGFNVYLTGGTVRDLVTGASILGDGTVVLILNVPAVVARFAKALPLGATA